MAIEPPKLEQINESQANQFLPEKTSIEYILKKNKVQPGVHPVTFGFKGDDVTSGKKAKNPGKLQRFNDKAN